jgi:hypothetical protein
VVGGDKANLNITDSEMRSNEQHGMLAQTGACMTGTNKNKILKSKSILALYNKYTRSLTFENLKQRGGASSRPTWAPVQILKNTLFQ